MSGKTGIIVISVLFTIIAIVLYDQWSRYQFGKDIESLYEQIEKMNEHDDYNAEFFRQYEPNEVPYPVVCEWRRGNYELWRTPSGMYIPAPPYLDMSDLAVRAIDGSEVHWVLVERPEPYQFMVDYIKALDVRQDNIPQFNGRGSPGDFDIDKIPEAGGLAERGE